MSQGKGVRAAHFEGTLPFSLAYGQLPPFYMLVQSWIYKIAGFSVAAMRLPVIFYYILYLFLVLFIFSQMHAAALFSAPITFLISLMAVLFPIDLRLMHTGRPDTLGVLMGTAGLAILARKKMSAKSLKSWLAAGIFVGLGLSCNFQMILFTSTFIILVLFFSERPLAKKITLSAVPFLVLIGLWTICHGSHSINAIRSLRQIMKTGQQGTFDLSTWLYAMVHRISPTFQDTGELLLPLILICWICVLIIFCFFRTKPLRAALWISAAHFGILFITGSYLQRIFTFFPIALACLGIALNYFPLNRFTRIAFVSFLLFLTAGSLTGQALYAFATFQEWENRDPGRFHELLRPLPENTKILASLPFWHELNIQKKKNFRIIALGEIVDMNYWQANENKFQEFDYILMYTDTILEESVVKTGMIFRRVWAGHEPFVEFSKPSPVRGKESSSLEDILAL